MVTSAPVKTPLEKPLRRRRLRLVFTIPVALITLTVFLCVGLWVFIRLTTNSVTSVAVTAQTTQFDGRYLIAASDADMVGTAYADGVVMQIPGDVDTLSLIELPVIAVSARVIELPVSNSVISYPQIIAVAPDGNAIYVVETAGQLADDVTQRPTDQFPIGRIISRIVIENGAVNAEVTSVDIGASPIHIALSADGAYLAVGMRQSAQQLAILPTATFDNPSTFNYFAIQQSDGQPAEEVTAVSWHPSGNFLAVGNDSRELQFYRVTHKPDDRMTLTPHGERLLLGNTITYGQFTSDGRYYLTAEINWNTVSAPLGNLVNPPGKMISVQFDADETVAHEVVSTVTVGLSPEGFAVSPQEDLIVTVNMRRTYLPDTLAAVIAGGDLNSLSLLSFDNQTGELRVLGGEYGFEGVLPEQAMFDADGDALAVVIYNEREDPMKPGYVEFWNVIRSGDQPRLVRTAVRVSVVRGPHALNLVP
jgi:hypothetical protein